MGLQEFDHVGRISKQAMLVSFSLHVARNKLIQKGSTIALFALAISAACVRFYIRIGIQKQFAIDDALLLFGILCIAASVGLLFNYIDDLFLVEALEYGDPALLAELPKDWIEDVYHYQERSAIGLMCAWAAIASVKFSFLFFFKRLIDRIQSMTRYWWAVFILNLAIAGYGFAIYILACPHFNSPEICALYSYLISIRLADFSAVKCNEGSAVGRVIDYAISQMVLDIFTDLTSMKHILSCILLILTPSLSFGHSYPYRLANQNPLGAKASPRILALSHYRHDRPDYHPGLWSPPWLRR